MSRRLVWRIWLYRMGRAYERWLTLAARVGFGGLVLTVLLGQLAPDLGPGWPMIMMGICLVLAGMGHALLGEEVSVRAYLTGESEAMPAATRLASGLLASGGGILMAAMGLVQWMG